MPLCPLTRCLFPLMAEAPNDSQNPFEHAPFTLPEFRHILMLAPLSPDDVEEDMYNDTMANAEASAACEVEAGEGFVLDQERLARLKKVDSDRLSEYSLRQATEFWRGWLWSRVQVYRSSGHSVQYALDKINLRGGRNGKLDMEGKDGGSSHFQRVIQTLFNLPGGIMDVVEGIMKQAGVAPAHAWRLAREENRRGVDGRPPVDEHAVALPGCGANNAGASVQDAVAEAVFGPDAISQSGKAFTVYAAVCKVLIDRAWERLTRRLKSAVKRSKERYKEFEPLMDAAKRDQTMEAMDLALRALTQWRVEAEVTLETEDPLFTENAITLSGMYAGEGVDMQAVMAAKNRRTVKRRASRKKQVLQLPSAAQVDTAREEYRRFCEALRENTDSQIPIGPASVRVDLVDAEEDIGVSEYVGMSVEELFAALGLPGATHFPFANTGSGTQGPIRPLRHQVIGVSAILKRAFTRIKEMPGLPTLLCDDVGLGKTVQIVGVIQMIAHLREQQQRSPAKKLQPPPFAIANETRFLAGLDNVPNRPHLIVVPHTLSSQWVQELSKFTAAGSFHVVRYSADQGDLARFFSDPGGDYLRAAGLDASRADRVIVVADLSAIECEAIKTFKKPKEMGSYAAQLELAAGSATYLKRQTDGPLPGSIWEQLFASVSYDESHNLHNDRMTTLASQILSENSLVRIAATATPIFTGPKDICSQGRILRHQRLVGSPGQDLFREIRASQKANKRSWPDDMAEVKAEAVERDTAEIVRKERAEDLPARKAEIEQMVKARYGSEDQLKVLETEYVNDDAIEMLREVMEHVIVHRRGDSKDETGAPIIPIPPYVEVALWSVLDEEEQAALARVNKVYREHKERRLNGLSFDPGELKWEDVLTSQKDACLLAALVKIRKWAKREKVSPIPEMLKIPAGWMAESIDSVLSSRLRAVDEAVKHFWEGNPKPPVYRADGSRDADLEDQQPDPPPLLRPRKFIIFIEFTVHRCMVKKMLELHGRKCVKYHGDMTVKQRQKAADTFKEDRECRVMLISKVGGAGLNLDVASILIFMSPLWSGLERKQLIGRLWRLGQLNQVIILDIIAPGGPDLVLAGYAGSKTALANNFLRVDVEQKLYEARCTSNAVLRDMERADDPTSDDELIEEAPVAGLPQARPSRVQPRKRKADALEDADEATSSGHDVSELGAYASATGKRARTAETSAPSGSATLSASHHQPATGSLSPVGQLGATNLAAPLKAAKFRGQRGGGRGRRAGGSGRGRDTSPEPSHSLESRASSSLRSPRSPAAEPRYPSPQPLPRVRSSHFGLRSSPPLLPSSSPPPPPSSPPMAPSSPVSSPSPSPPPPSRVLLDILQREDARVQPQRATPVPVLGLRSVVVSSGSVWADTPMRTQQSADPAPPRPKPRPKLRAAPSTAEIEDSTDIFDLSSSTVPRVRRETPALPHDGLASSAYKTQGSSREPIPARRSPPTALAAPRGNSPGDELQAPGVETTAAPLNPAASLSAKRLPPSGSERGADGVERMRAIQARLSSTATTRRVSAVVVPIPRKPQGSDGAGTQSTLNSQAAQAEGQGASSGTGSSRAVEPSARQQQQHKRSGFGRQTIKAAAGTSRAKAKATTLDERDAQLLAPSAGPSAQPRRQRPSMFDERQ